MKIMKFPLHLINVVQNNVAILISSAKGTRLPMPPLRVNQSVDTSVTRPLTTLGQLRFQDPLSPTTDLNLSTVDLTSVNSWIDTATIPPDNQSQIIVPLVYFT